MSDLAILMIVAGFGLLTWLLVVLCDRLMGDKR
jgi:hypothetical protein